MRSLILLSIFFCFQGFANKNKRSNNFAIYLGAGHIHYDLGDIKKLKSTTNFLTLNGFTRFRMGMSYSKNFGYFEYGYFTELSSDLLIIGVITTHNFINNNKRRKLIPSMSVKTGIAYNHSRSLGRYSAHPMIGISPSVRYYFLNRLAVVFRVDSILGSDLKIASNVPGNDSSVTYLNLNGTLGLSVNF
ncbi:MAG: hypothetical protein ACR2M7_01335 [Bdellovibrionales bacterium]